MALPFYNWSRTAASNSSADATVNWAEGQAPSSVNDSARAMMASTAAYRDDIAGAIATGGTSTAYTVTSYQVFDTLAHMSGQVVAFTPHTTNGATVTLNVDGLGAKPLRSAPSVELVAGTLVQGTPYTCLYNNSDAVFYLRDFYVNPYIVPIGSCIDYFGTTAPNSAFALAYGQAISRTTYATLFTLFSTTFGTGDGSTTFNIPDLRGRVLAGKDNMGGSAASRLDTTNGGVDGATLGAVGGSQNVTLAANQIPTITATNAAQSITVASTSPTGATKLPNQASSFGGGATGVAYNDGSATAAISSTGNNSISATYTNSSQQVTKLAQPTIISNKLIRLI